MGKKERRQRFHLTHSEIPARELLEPRAEDPWKTVSFNCRPTEFTTGCGPVQQTLNMRTGHVVDQSPGQDVAIFWINTQDLTPQQYLEIRGADALLALVGQGHVGLRHPGANRTLAFKRKGQ